MRHFILSIGILVAACGLAPAQSIVLKDGITKLGPDMFKVEGGKVMKLVKIGDKIGQSELQLSSVSRLEWPAPEELTKGTELLAGGKTEEGLAMLKKGREFFEPFKDIPGNYFSELSLAYVEALNQANKTDDVIKLMPAIKKLKLTESQKTQLNIIQLNADRQTGAKSPDSIIADARNILDVSDDSAVCASLWMLVGDTQVKLKKYEDALFSYLRVPVFYGTQIQRVPEAEIAAARCLAKMRRFEDASSYYKRLQETYTGSNIAEVAKTEEASIHGLKNEDETPAKGGDKKEATEGDAAKPADAAEKK